MFEQIPLCYFNTSVLFVDNDPNFLKILDGIVDDRYHSVQRQNPHKALIDLEQNRQKKPFTEYREALSTLFSEKEGDFISEVGSLSVFSRLLGQGDNTIFSVAVVDYDMPHKNGEELLREVKVSDENTITVMLTERVEYSKGVDYHNESILRYFLSKNDSQMSTKLLETLAKSRIDYFLQFSSRCDAILSDWIKMLYKDSGFVSLLNQVFEKNSISAFCLIDTEGSLYLWDSDGSEYVLLVRRLASQKVMIKNHMDEESLELCGVSLEALTLGNKTVFCVGAAPSSFDTEPHVFSGVDVLISLEKL